MKIKFRGLERISNIEEFVHSLKFDELEFSFEPLRLFHYTSGQCLKNIIENKELWLSNIEIKKSKIPYRY